MEWPFVSRREYQRALAERNEADRCFVLAQADNATLRKELDAAVNMDLEVKVRQSLEAKLSKMEEKLLSVLEVAVARGEKLGYEDAAYRKDLEEA